MFDRMEVAEQFHKGEHLLKHPLGHKPTVMVTSGNEMEEKPPHLPTPRRAVLTAQDKNAGHLSDTPTGSKNKCLFHGPRHTSHECNVLKVYSEKYDAQRPHQNKEARSSGKPQRGKNINFDKNTQEVNVM